MDGFAKVRRETLTVGAAVRKTIKDVAGEELPFALVVFDFDLGVVQWFYDGNTAQVIDGLKQASELIRADGPAFPASDMTIN